MRRLLTDPRARFALVLALVTVTAAVVVSVAAALRFSDAPCIETSGGGTRACPSGVVGSAYSTQLQGDGGCGPALPYQYKILNGGLPSGLSLSKGGLISGTPTGSGTAVFWIELSDENPPSQSWCNPPKTAEREFSITIQPGFRIDNEITTKYGTLSVPYSDQLTATILTSSPPPAGAPKATATWTKISGDLPPGMTLGSTGLVSGTPTSEGVFTFKVRAEVDASRTDEETFVIDIKRAVTITAPRVPSSEVGVPFELTLVATGGTGANTYTWTLDGTLPTEITFDSVNVTLSGTPSEAGAFAFTATATDQQGRVATYQGRIVVAAKLAISTLRLKPGKVGRLYRAKLATTGGVQPKKWKLKGKLPRGIRFDKTLGVLSGTPLKPGRYQVTAEATDALNVKTTKKFTIVVLA